jgi:hypothetical protein
MVKENLYRLFPKKRRKPYLRYLWLDLNKTKTVINHFKNTISTTWFFFQKVIQGQIIQGDLRGIMSPTE